MKIVHHFFILILFANSTWSFEYCPADDDYDIVNNDDPVCDTHDCVVAAGSLLSVMNLDANPCDDFYEYACGNFKSLNSIPTGEGKFDPMHSIARKIELKLLKLLEQDNERGTSSSAESKAKAYFHSCMDMEKISNSSIQLLRRMVEKLGGLYVEDSQRMLSNGWSLNKLLKSFTKMTANSGPFVTQVDPDDQNTLQNVIKMGQSGLGLGEDTRDFYIGNSHEHQILLSAYADLLVSYVDIIYGPEHCHRQMIVDVVEFEKRVAQLHLPLHERERIKEVYFKTNVTWLQENANFINWLQYFNDLFANVDITIDWNEPVLLFGHEYFIKLADLINDYLWDEDGRRTLQNYFVLRAIDMYVPYLGGQFEQARAKFMNVMVGKQGCVERYKLCIADTNDNVGFGLASMFIRKHFSMDLKYRVGLILFKFSF